MLVRDRMSYPVITIRPDTPIHDALNLLHEEKIRRLPVVDKKGRLVGMVSDRDLMHASPSAATSLSIWEVNYLLSKLTVDQVMKKKVITVPEDTPLEEVARIMADNQIGAIPIEREGQMVGIITETDLFKIFVEMLGARQPGVRLSVLIPNLSGELARLTKAIYEAGGSILALGTALGENSENREVTVKVANVDRQTLVTAIEPLVERILDVRELASG